jgi:glycosyltransferase involved in cell wall biosynthesis
MALELFAKRHPEIRIHLYGDRIGKLPFPLVDHGVLRPDELNRIYNRCFAALSLSMTNVSLVPYEMLSAGCIPVVNDAEHNRIVLDNPFIRYAAPTPHALARALEEVVTTEDFAALSAAASASVFSASWSAAGVAAEQCMRRVLQG